MEATIDPTAPMKFAQGFKFHDHVLLTVQDVINGTLLCALVDNGGTRSFIDKKLHLTHHYILLERTPRWSYLKLTK